MKFGTRERPKPEGVMHQMAAREAEPTSGLGWVLYALAVIVPAGAVYIWRSGLL